MNMTHGAESTLRKLNTLKFCRAPRVDFFKDLIFLTFLYLLIFRFIQKNTICGLLLTSFLYSVPIKLNLLRTDALHHLWDSGHNFFHIVIWNFYDIFWNCYLL